MQVILSEEEWKQVLKRDEVKRLYSIIKTEHEKVVKMQAQQLIANAGTSESLTHQSLASMPHKAIEHIMRQHQPLIDAMRKLSDLIG